MKPRTCCPDLGTLHALTTGNTPEVYRPDLLAEDVSTHVETCETCRADVAAMLFPEETTPTPDFFELDPDFVQDEVRVDRALRDRRGEHQILGQGCARQVRFQACKHVD